MKTILFSPVYLDDNGQKKLDRWIEYYGESPIQYGQMMFAADGYGSSTDECLYPNVIQFPNHLGRHSHLGYAGWWRSFYTMKLLMAPDVDKIVFIEQDAFVLTKRLADYINNSNSGWLAPFCETHRFPESALQIINKDAFGKFHWFTSGNFWENVGKVAETILPFTQIMTQFNCDRYGEKGLSQTKDMDLYCQANLDTIVRFDL